MPFPRFFSSEIVPHATSQLSGDELAHASVLRLKVGDRIAVFNGCGEEAAAVIEAISKKSLSYLTSEVRHVPRVLPGRVCVAVSLPKSERQRSVVEKLVELGVHELIPIHTRRSVASVSTRNLDRLHRWNLESCKQSGRNAFLTIHSAIDFSRFVTDPRWRSLRRWIAHPEVKNTCAPVDFRQFAEPSLFCVGPEGGFADEELEIAYQFGFRPLVLGDRILRVETAVTYVCAIAAMALQPPRSGSEFS